MIYIYIYIEIKKAEKMYLFYLLIYSFISPSYTYGTCEVGHCY